MDKNTQLFIGMIRNRNRENQKAIELLSPYPDTLSPTFTILRQELDSMIRVIYLLAINDIQERQRLIDSTLRGEKWRIQTSKKKWRYITDQEMVDLSQRLQGWTKSVYKFGSAFVHLSNFHDHFVKKPFDGLEESEKQDILSHMRHYHNGQLHDNPEWTELSSYLPNIFKKIANNLNCYIEMLEKDEKLNPEDIIL